MRWCALLGSAVLLIALLAPPSWAAQPPGQPWLGLTLADALERLRSMGLNLVYSTKFVRPGMRISVEPTGSEPQEILEQLLAPFGLASRPGADGVVMIVRAPTPRPPQSTIRGVVTAQDSGLPLAAAEVAVVGSDVAVRSGGDGRFELHGVAVGSHTLEARCFGYLPGRLERVVVVPGSAADVVIELVAQPRFLQEVVVTPSRYGLLDEQAESQQFLDREQVLRLPHLSDDLLRVVHRLPGTAAGDISATFGVRGGVRDEVMFILDGLEIYEPFHLRDFFHVFSVFDSEAVGGVQLMTGGFTAEYGDRMSGIVNVTSAVPRDRQRSAGLSTLNTRSLTAGVWDQGRATWLLSARQGYLDLVWDWFRAIGRDPDLNTSPDYYDVFATVRRPVGDTTLLAVNLLGSYDRIHLTDDGNNEDLRGRESAGYLWASLDTAASDTLSMQTIASATRVAHRLWGSSFNPGESSTEIDDERQLEVLGLKQDWSWHPSAEHLLKWGADARWVSASYDHVSVMRVEDPLFTGGGPPTESSNQTQLDPSGWQLGLYLADRFQITRGLFSEVGVRWDSQSWTPGADQVSPRGNLVWVTPRWGTVRAAWGRFSQSQAIHQLQVEDGVETFLPAQWAEHRVISWERQLGSSLVVRAEAYHKTMTDLRPRFENLFEPFEMLPAGEPDRVRIAPERAEARGLELVFRSAHDRRLTWWAGYTLSWSEDRVEGVWQPRSWDQRHSVSFSVNWQLEKGWNVNLSGASHSGWPTTPVFAHWQQSADGTYFVRGEIGQRNSDRYPPYHRLDLRVSRTVRQVSGSLRFFLEVANLLDRKNVRSTGTFMFSAGPDGTIEVAADHEEWLPILPSLGLSWEF
jgi:hypothetical protein